MAMGDAMRWLADGNAFWAIVELTGFVWAHNVAVWLLALDITNGVLWFLA